MDSKKHMWETVKSSSVIAAYSVAGIYIARSLRGSSMPIATSQVAFVAGTAAVSAWGAPMLTKMVVCPKSDIAPYAEAAASAALSWPIIYWATGDANNANMFLPVQALSHFSGKWALKMWQKPKDDTHVETMPIDAGGPGGLFGGSKDGW